MNRWIISLPPNRTRRNYRGGALLDRWEGKPDGADGDRPEDWIASTTRAVNPGLPPVENEGLARVLDGERRLTVAELFASAPEHYLGARHVEAVGTELGFLLKLLDSAMRLHVQAHPTREFARRHLDSRWGKLETYVVLETRPDVAAYIRLGFQRAPSAEEWRRIVLEQDIAAMDACFDPIPVRPGEVWRIPGGLPHALGEGLLVLETMEPTDLVVRCEFEREGIVVPPAARFMQRDPDFALKIFDLASLSVEDATSRYRVEPAALREDDACREERLIGPEHTDCFSIVRVDARAAASVAKTDRVHIGVVTEGRGEIGVRDEKIEVARGSRFLIAAAAQELRVRPGQGRPLQCVLVRPGEAPAADSRLAPGSQYRLQPGRP